MNGDLPDNINKMPDNTSNNHKVMRKDCEVEKPNMKNDTIDNVAVNNKKQSSNNNKDRKRLYSWSRPTREMRRAGNNSGMMHAEHIISGSATIVFPPSLNWFQGNIINSAGDAYTIHGKQRRDSQNSNDDAPSTRLPTLAELPEDNNKSSLSTQSNHSSENGEILRINYSGNSSTSLDEECSVCDSLDSALVERAMARLSLELGSEFVYNVTITDYETGLEHEVKEVSCSIDKEKLKLEHNQLQFTSETALKGAKADTVIATKIGPGLVEKGLTVYSGKLRMTYQDAPCYPVALEASQWCL